MSNKRILRWILYVLGVAIIVLAFWPVPYSQASVGGKSRGARPGLNVIRNETLGVQKVFAINKPSRVDRRDNIVLGSTVSDFYVEFIDGVSPEDIDPETYPYNLNSDFKPAQYAARRAHVNVMQRIVHQRLGSAIVFEDDVDWDVTIKTQLQSFALAVRTLQKTERARTASPYGDDWDVLWIGHCGVDCRLEEPFFLTPNELTVVPPAHFLPYLREVPRMRRPENSRMACTLNDGVCSNGYAVSQRGAQRILAALSVSPSPLADQIDIGAEFDVVLGRMCGHGYLRCFAPYPSLTGKYREAGLASKSSDIASAPEKMVEAESHGLMYSTMLNLNRILNGEPTVHSTWDDVPTLEIDPNAISTPQGGTIQMQGAQGIYAIRFVPW
ncbi:hypothetical protein N7474_004658 [Penicillium riverlandense]|uniref:uncharacterized protein n=1 Tax=Penicillium riverlandense TaxID=1903569 RepID=UPI0025467192|nr:uncharacterized protein N7474_004658 [Penicillium riverlandense]KAJ5819067.1 hypothetical protein N7474_004658 [Penicillium riverlandense]